MASKKRKEPVPKIEIEGDDVGPQLPKVRPPVKQLIDEFVPQLTPDEVQYLVGKLRALAEKWSGDGGTPPNMETEEPTEGAGGDYEQLFGELEEQIGREGAEKVRTALATMNPSMVIKRDLEKLEKFSLAGMEVDEGLHRAALERAKATRSSQGLESVLINAITDKLSGLLENPKVANGLGTFLESIGKAINKFMGGEQGG